MNKQQVQLAWALGIQLALLIAIVISVLWLQEAKASFQDTWRNQVLCSQLSEEILDLRNLQSVAQDKDVDEDLSNRKLIDLATTFSISENQLQSIQRLIPTKIENTDYSRQDISVTLKSIALPKLLELALALEEQHPSTKITSIRLSSSRQARFRNEAVPAGSEEVWNADLVLTQLVFAATRTVP